MEVIVDCAEEARKSRALDDGLLNDIEIGLDAARVSCVSLHILKGRWREMRTFTNPLFNPYMAFRAAGFENDSVFGPSRTTSPYFSCSLMWVSSGRRAQTSTNRHQSVNEAKKGPGYLFRPWRNRFLASHATSNTPTTVVQCCSNICNTSSVIPCILSLLKGGGGRCRSPWSGGKRGKKIWDDREDYE